MASFAIDVLWGTSLILPIVVFLLVNPLASIRAKLFAATVAVGAGWCLTVAYAVAARAIALSEAGTRDQQLAVLDHDGAPLAFAMTLGWIPGLVVVLATSLTRATFARRVKGL
jgi:hypothetical protein